ncbi:hypothetical protein IW139_003341 [Coemansia sp. RSA 353]|nr:hypothetical protein LPJ54_000496 [Coemansia sp. RSA 1824]KAJ2195519.1 hypothetical protein IW144_003414 [Coemansia sp. RSA 522]KAJ2228304.1 hypothetical protein EV180_002046 [Coemansia sp. RSA 518]KAJ2296482.1 hypothetical protein IW139_003341 [Coemansia sp. RSA 353]
MSVSGHPPSARPPAHSVQPVRKPRKAFKSSAFIPAEWRFDNNADGVVGLITEVVMAIDRQHMFSDGQNAEVRQHIHHNASQKPRGLGQGHQKQSRSQHRSPSGQQQHHGKHRSSSHGQHHSQHRGLPHAEYQRSRGLQENGAHHPNSYDNEYQYNHGMQQEYEAPYANPYDNGYQHSRGVQHDYGPGSHDSGRQRSRGLRDAAASHVNVIDDRHSVFSMETTRKRVLPRGTRAVTSDAPVATKCPRCKESIMTVIKRHTGGKNIAATAAVAAAGVAVNAPATLLPLALAVLDLGSLKRKAHHCPYCDYRMGKHVTITIPRD